MRDKAANETPGAGSGQLQVINTPVRDRRIMKVEVGGRVMEVSLAEMESYCDLFEEMFDELDGKEFKGIEEL